MEGVEEAEDEAPRKRGRGGVKGLCGAVRFWGNRRGLELAVNNRSNIGRLWFSLR